MMVGHEGPAAGSLEKRLEFETLISDLSSRFINLPPAAVDHEIEDALRRVCELLGLDYAVLWQWMTTTDVLAPTHAYPPLEPSLPGERLGPESYPWVTTQIRAGRMVVLPSLDRLPPEATVDLESARRIGIKSNLCLPLVVGGEQPFGALAFNTLQAERDWPDVLVKRLQLVAQVLANALARKRTDQALQESQERLSLAADSAGAGLWTLEYSTGVFWATARARAMFGYLADEVITRERVEASVHPDDRDLVRGAIEQSARAGEAVNVEYRIVLPDNRSVRWIASRGRPRFASTGEPERLMGISIDITARKQAEEAHRTSEDRLSAGVDLAGLAFYEVDFGERTVFVDDRFRDVCGIPPEPLYDLEALEFWIEHLHPDDRERVLEQRTQLHEGKVERLIIDYRYLHPTQGERWLHHVARVTMRDATGHVFRTFGVLRDITQLKGVEEELRDLSRRLIRAHEEERALLARELHDDVTQRLALLAIEVGRAELAAPEGSHTEAMRSVREGLVGLSEDIHSLAYQLHPSVLEELGLAEALRAECERLVRQGQVDVSLELDPLPAVVGRDAALCLFRVAQGALNNVTRHAGGRAASVTLRQMDGGLLLAVRDDGVGFDPASPGTGGSLGLASMRERVRLVNGTLDIESAPGRGTAIIAWVPVKAETQ